MNLTKSLNPSILLSCQVFRKFLPFHNSIIHQSIQPEFQRCKCSSHQEIDLRIKLQSCNRKLLPSLKAILKMKDLRPLDFSFFFQLPIFSIMMRLFFVTKFYIKKLWVSLSFKKSYFTMRLMGMPSFLLVDKNA